MDLEFTDEQLDLRDSARSELARECPPGLVRGVADGAPGTDRFATALTWLGWPALTIPLDLGGLGRSFVELAVVLEEMGRVAAPTAFLPTMTQFVPVVRAAGTTAQAHRFLSGVAAGDLTGTLALHEGGRWGPETVMATAERDGDGWLLHGHKQHVLGAPEVSEVVVAARRESGSLGLFVVPAAELTFKRTATIDPTRSLANVELNGVWVPDARALGEPEADAGRALAQALDYATVGLALDALGACGALLDSSFEVARTSAAAGQAIEHALADMLVATETARAAVYQATAAVSEGHPSAPHAASVAKAAIGGCQRLVTRQALEIHGAAGGPDLRLWVGRAKADDLLFGTTSDHRRIVADHVLSARRARSSQLATALFG
ncbi:MAG: acyl-CoA/acyl-ACP dehydrogenase [Acidimicrobiales bacterium]|nr:acyl-CoA/acyl-ACP dehydrogenase [Acidimicrobiales bacterium]